MTADEIRNTLGWNTVMSEPDHAQRHQALAQGEIAAQLAELTASIVARFPLLPAVESNGLAITGPGRAALLQVMAILKADPDRGAARAIVVGEMFLSQKAT